MYYGEEELVKETYVEPGELIEEQTFVDTQAVAEEVMDYAFTFGYNHIWPLTGTTLGKNYVKLRGTFDGTRDEMNRRFNKQWSMQYRFDDKFQLQIEKYKLAEIRLEFPDGENEFK